ncbi:MAG: hypothetical protein A3H23_04605 [Planctomycetes bacterium RIFCSPLOWO2_12_FULL_40_19]|nr:MAG: hypothetical protein A3H23_04605 [Planctomycetes bacterium RIFCSPLOWO2_12_FULL_40_19]
MNTIIHEGIRDMSRIEKIKLMEILWEDLSRDDDFQSPEWHKDELRKTEKRLSEGLEKKMDWEIAKKKLKKRFE